jgi:Glyoxalase/Bleomycin resistance protein/Dioxygenase superfamily
MNQVQVEQKSYQMPPQDGFTIAHFLTVADVERSLRFYETVFGGRILSRGDSSGAPGYIQIANTWLLVNPGGGPTPDKPSVTLSVPANPDSVSSFIVIYNLKPAESSKHVAPIHRRVLPVLHLHPVLRASHPTGGTKQVRSDLAALEIANEDAVRTPRQQAGESGFALHQWQAASAENHTS